MDEPVSQVLLARVQARDEAAARELVRCLGPRVQRVVRAHLPRRTDEEDLCQEVFMSVFRHLPQFRGAVPFEHWVSRVAVNTCLDQLRREKARPELRWADLSEEQAAMLHERLKQGDGQRDMPSREARELINLLLDRLAVTDRLILQWLELEELSVKEISARSGWSVPGVKVRAFRARQRLRAALNILIESEHPDSR